MRQFKRFFALLFVVSTLLGALHEMIHHHTYDMDNHVEESCPLYLLAQSEVLTTKTYQLPNVDIVYDPFIPHYVSPISTTSISSKSRSPPHA